MAMTLLEIIRFPLPVNRSSSFTSKFLHLRNILAARDGVHHQYFGGSFGPLSARPTPTKEDDEQMCWVIHWPHNSFKAIDDATSSLSFRKQLEGLLTNANDNAGGDKTGVSEPPTATARSLFFEIPEEQVPELTKALEAPVTEFAMTALSPTVNPRFNGNEATFQASLQKAYMDCFRAGGFLGGKWGFAINTDDAAGEVVGVYDTQTAFRIIEEKERKLACYILGWENVEAHRTYSKTPIHEEELSKLRPWFSEGTGMWYVAFERHQNQNDNEVDV